MATGEGPRAGRPRRRAFTADYKMRILAEYEQLDDPGERGALLRREGLYTSHISEWRKARDKGAAGGLAEKPAGRPGRSAADAENERLRKENEKLAAELARTKAALEVVGKAHALWPWLATRWAEAATWREFGYAALLVTVLWPIDVAVAVLAIGTPLAFITAPIPVIDGGQRGLLPGLTISSPLQAASAVPAGLALLVVAAYLVTALALVQARLARTLLSSRGPELRARLTELTLSRARLVDAFEAERRRIERDLHDGAQQRLVAVSMSLGLARLDMPPGPAADQVAHAHDQAKLALTEIRQLIHGIYPQVLTDRGLPAAAEEAADRSTVPVDLKLRLNRRLPQAVEATAYFVICEALANIAKHSKAAQAWIRADLSAGRLLVEIGDDGVGGADAEHGSGMAGLADRVAVVGGSMSVSSPLGGPTVLLADLPCP